MPTAITLTGFKEFEEKLKRMPDILASEVDGECGAAAKEWDELAKLMAPKDVGFLVGGISNYRKEKMWWEVTSKANYSAYMEWGTKSRVSVPADLTAYASQFKGGGGKGLTKEFIYAWCKRKGIPENAWWPIFISIVTKGVKPQPFFFIQVPIVEKGLFSKVDKILKTEH